MSTTENTRTIGTDWFRTAQGLLVPPVQGVTAIGPTTTTACTSCHSTVRARPQFGERTLEYVLPLDELGRCPTCAWVQA